MKYSNRSTYLVLTGWLGMEKRKRKKYDNNKIESLYR